MPAPHGDPLLQAAQAEPGHQAIGVGEVLPVRGMPSKQGEWVKKRGMLVLWGKTCCATSAHKQQRQNAFGAHAGISEYEYHGCSTRHSFICWVM